MIFTILCALIRYVRIVLAYGDIYLKALYAHKRGYMVIWAPTIWGYVRFIPYMWTYTLYAHMSV